MLRLQHFLQLLTWFVVIGAMLLSLGSTIDIIFIKHQLQEIMSVLKNVRSLGLLNSYKPKTTAQVLVSWELDMTFPFWPSAAVTHPRWSCMKIPITAYSIVMEKLPKWQRSTTSLGTICEGLNQYSIIRLMIRVLTWQRRPLVLLILLQQFLCTIWKEFWIINPTSMNVIIPLVPYEACNSHYRFHFMKYDTLITILRTISLHKKS